MRIGILGPAPFVPTGYGNLIAQLSQICRALGHEVACFATAGLSHAPIQWQGMPVYPTLYADMGQDHAMSAAHWQADVVMPVMDLWVMEMAAWQGIRLAPWFPVDHAPLSPHLKSRIEQCFFPIVYSQFGQRECHAAGAPVHYVPCGVDTALFHPIDRLEARRMLDWPKDRYIVGMVQANVGRPSRKAFYPQLRAFKYFQQQHPEALLYLHTFLNLGNETDGEHLMGMLDTLGLEIDKDVLIVDQYQYTLGLPATHLAACYNAMNVLLQVPHGEGFGLPLVEAQACGTPVVTGDWTSTTELCFAGQLVPRSTATVYGQEIADDELWGSLGGLKVIPRVSSILTALEQVYQTGDTQRELARLGAMQYDVRTIARDYWQPVLAEMESRL